jgi:hypothetical protein
LYTIHNEVYEIYQQYHPLNGPVIELQNKYLNIEDVEKKLRLSIN